jgi:LAO/AO transport system kinase
MSQFFKMLMKYQKFMKKLPRNRLTVEQLYDGILGNNRTILSQAITLIESNQSEDQILAQELLTKLINQQNNQSLRIGITGAPGVGKSSFIESFGQYITQKLNLSMVVLAIDPSSQKSRGSILGDKTRMEKLALNPKAYIRPSPSGDSLGGVTRKTREAVILCEAAGFEIIIIETVGVGQSETAVKGMVDFFLLLMLAGAGDELQGIKRGIMEMADAIAITKSDGDNLMKAKMAQKEFQNALHLFPQPYKDWSVPVVCCSALLEQGMAEIWSIFSDFINLLEKDQQLLHLRQNQQIEWMHQMILQQLETDFYGNTTVQNHLGPIKEEVRLSKIPASAGADQLMKIYKEFVLKKINS